MKQYIEINQKTGPSYWDTIDLDDYFFLYNDLEKHTGWDRLKKETNNVLLGNTMYYSAAIILNFSECVKQ